MNKNALIEALAAKANLTKKQTEDVMDAFIQVTMDTIKQGGEVTLTGFGTFSARVRKGREGINPRTKVNITVPPTLVVKFKAGKVLKDTLKNHQRGGQAAPAAAPSTPAAPATPAQ